jgi:hypothetical protein
MTAVTGHVVSTSRTAVRRRSTQAGAAPALWHFTCDHFVTDIRAVGALVPHRHPLFPTLGPVVWLTTQEDPDRYAVGLTSDTLACDRMANRFRAAETQGCLPWPDVRDFMRDLGQPGFDALTLAMFDGGRAPATWWVSPTAVPVVRR